jgi:hypothetical protein
LKSVMPLQVQTLRFAQGDRPVQRVTALPSTLCRLPYFSISSLFLIVDLSFFNGP